MEIGDYVNPGQSCATIVDLNPMLMVGRVSEKAVLELQLGELASGKLADGRVVAGPVTFIGQQSDPQTRTYAVEIQLDNSDRSLRSGITAEIKIPVDRVLAQRVSPALFALDDRGEIGIRVLDENNIVHFHNVEIITDDADGVWVTGLPNETTLITVGQEMVVAGERVDPDLQTMPSSTLARSLTADAQTSR
jgi:multidrug efflux system membrane fusion protein